MLRAQRVQPVETISWWRVLLVGLLLYFIGIAVLVLSGNPMLFPTVVMLGNFVVPITYVAFFYGRRHLSQLSLPTTAMSFFLWRRWREATRQQAAQIMAAEMDGCGEAMVLEARAAGS